VCRALSGHAGAQVGPFVVLWDFVAAFSRKIEVFCNTIFFAHCTRAPSRNVGATRAQVSPFSLEDLEASACHR
jgi:hypothetical protein